MKNSGIALTDRAATHIRNYLAKNGGGTDLRVGVKPTGCSGYQYVIETAENIGEHDLTFESAGINIVVDKQSLRYLAGTELDYVHESLKEGLVFNNPNVQETCGCGESFTIQEETEN